VTAIFKTIIATIIAGGVLIASFYVAYLMLVVVVLSIVGGISYLFFNKDKIFTDEMD